MKKPKKPPIGAGVFVTWIDSGLNCYRIDIEDGELSCEVMEEWGRVVGYAKTKRDRDTLIIRSSGPYGGRSENNESRASVHWPSVLTCEVVRKPERKRRARPR